MKKKKDSLISDNGVVEKQDRFGWTVIVICILFTILLIVLGILALANA